MTKSEKIICSHFWIISELDEIMETLCDLNLLNEEWKKVATKIWIATRKETKKENREQKIHRLMEEWWSKYDQWTRDFLIASANNWEMNQMASTFIKSKITH